MNSHNHSRLGLNLLPGEDGPARKFTAPLTPTLPPLEDDTELWMPTLPRPEAAAAPQAPPTQPDQPVAGQAFCQFCGGCVVPDAVLCVSCGRQIKVLQGAVNPQEKAGDKPASVGEFVLMVILTLALPLVGFLFGIIGLSRRGKQTQGGVLLALSIIFGAIYFAYFTTLHH